MEGFELDNRLFNYYRIMHQEKVKTRSDNFTIIYGRPRSGKTMLELQLMRYHGIISLYDELIRKNRVQNLSELSHELGMDTRLPKKWWEQTFRDHFCFDTEDANKKIKKGGYNNVLAMDEGIDVASWMGGMTIEKEEWNKLLLKIGEFGNTFFFITASVSLLDKNTLRRAKWLFIIAKVHEKDSNSAYLYKQWDDPIRAEKNPFDLNDVFDKIDKFKYLPTEQIYQRSKCYIGEVTYPWINEKVYALYLKRVKHPQMLMTERKRQKYVPVSRYEKLLNYAAIVTRNLRVMDDKTQGQIRKLAMTNDGKFLIGPGKIKELDTYGENLFFKYADIEEKLSEKTMAEKQEAFRRAKEEAAKTKAELDEIERLKEDKEAFSFKAFRGRRSSEFSMDEEETSEIVVPEEV